VKAAFRKEIPSAPKGQIETVSSGSNQFSLNLLRQVVKEQPNDNIVLYPLGLVQNLTLIHETAQGKSRETIENLLGVKGTTSNVLASFHSAFLNDLESDPYEAMKIANSVWISDRFKPKEEAVKRLDALFGCSVQSFSSNLDKAKQDMNAWVSKNTEGEIKEIQSQLSGATALVLLNALIFNGQWLHEFDPSKTEPSEFKTPTQTVSVPMMFARELKCRSSQNGDSPNAELSFLGGFYSFVVIVPEDAKSFKQTLSRMDAQTFSKLMRSMTDNEMNIFLPRLELSSKLS
jgi:serpin B